MQAADEVAAAGVARAGRAPTGWKVNLTKLCALERDPHQQLMSPTIRSRRRRRWKGWWAALVLCDPGRRRKGAGGRRRHRPPLEDGGDDYGMAARDLLNIVEQAGHIASEKVLGGFLTSISGETGRL